MSYFSSIRIFWRQQSLLMAILATASARRRPIDKQAQVLQTRTSLRTTTDVFDPLLQNHYLVRSNGKQTYRELLSRGSQVRILPGSPTRSVLIATFAQSRAPQKVASEHQRTAVWGKRRGALLAANCEPLRFKVFLSVSCPMAPADRCPMARLPLPLRT